LQVKNVLTSFFMLNVSFILNVPEKQTVDGKL
jgi:hypothetical protein